MQRNRQSKVTIAFFIFMAFVMGMGVIAPFLRQEATVLNTPSTDPTTVPTATVPAPMVDFGGISFKQVYLHPSGLFTVGQPTGWLPLTPIADPGRAGVTMFNQSTLSIIEVSVEQPTTPITTVDQLDARNDKTYLAASWARYGTWTETARKHDGDQLIIDFNLTLNNQQYVARQLSWSDGQWVYNVRVVAPSNATQMLLYLVGELAKAITPYKQFYGTPFEWTSYYDSQTNAIIRYPATWTVADAAPGRPASITSADGHEMRVETQANVTIADEAAAGQWVDGTQSGATILSVEPVTHGDASGFSVAYSYTTVDGDPRSGVALLLNGPGSTLYAANLRFAGSSIDVNALRKAAQASAAATPEATAEATQAAVSADAQMAEVVDTFWILPALDLAPSTETTTPTPLPATPSIVIPTLATEAATAEATAAATSAATVEATEAAPAVTVAPAAPAATVEATMVATAEATP